MVLSKKDFNKALTNTKVKEYEDSLEESIDEALLNYADWDEEKRRSNAGYAVISFEGNDTWDKYGDSHTYHETALGNSMSKFTNNQQEIIRDYIVNKYKEAGWDITWNDEDVGFGSHAHVLRISTRTVGHENV